MRKNKLENLMWLMIVTGCLFSSKVIAETVKPSADTSKLKITLPRPKIDVTDDFVRSLPLDSAKKLMFEKLETYTGNYEKDYMSQLQMDLEESPISVRRLKKTLATLINERKTSSELIPSALTPIIIPMLDKLFSSFQSRKSQLDNHIQNIAISATSPLAARIDQLQDRLNKLDSVGPVSSKKSFKEIIESFKNPAMLILLFIQLATTIFVVYKLN